LLDTGYLKQDSKLLDKLAILVFKHRKSAMYHQYPVSSNQYPV